MQRTFSLLVVLFLFSISVFGQARCLDEKQKATIIDSAANPQNSDLNRQLRTRLILMKRGLDNMLLWRRYSTKQINTENELRTRKLCEIYIKYGWLTKFAVGQQGVEAAQLLIRYSYPKSVRLEFLPILNVAAKKGFMQKSEFAEFADLVNVESGFPQLFGTQADTTGDIVYLHPLFDKNKVDKWRKDYNLPPLNDYLQYLETKYNTIVVKKPLPVAAYNFKENIGISNNGRVTRNLLEKHDVLRVDTRLVNLNVRLLNKNGLPAKRLKLTKDDFEVYEDNQKQAVSFLSSSETAFDLILLLDLSGSTKGKRDIIWKAVERFVKATRRTDRVAIVTHRPNLMVLSEFVDDKEKAVKKAKQFKEFGGSNIWDALYLTHEQMIKRKSKGRRTAIVHLTDGEEVGSRLAFGTLLEYVRDWDTTIFPIHLATSNDAPVYRKAYKTLKLLATETGGQYYGVKEIQDLAGVYEKIAKDLSQVYSLGYETTNANQRGAFRQLTVKIKNRPDLSVRARSGYYAN